jgi:hypothetical protein
MTTKPIDSQTSGSRLGPRIIRTASLLTMAGYHPDLPANAILDASSGNRQRNRRATHLLSSKAYNSPQRRSSWSKLYYAQLNGLLPTKRRCELRFGTAAPRLGSVPENAVSQALLEATGNIVSGYRQLGTGARPKAVDGHTRSRRSGQPM